MGWITTGTVNLVNGSNVVTGVGSKFLEDARIGDGFRGPNGMLYEVTNVPTNTSLTIQPAYEGATVNAAPYFLVPIEGYVKESADQLRVATGQIALIPGSKQDKHANLTALSGLSSVANLTAFAGLTGAVDRIPYFTGAGALSLATLTAKARSLNACADTASMQAVLSLVPVTSNTDSTAGRILLVNSFGVGGLLPRIEASTIDSLRDSGRFYLTAVGGPGSTPAGIGVGYLDSVVYAATYAIQWFSASDTGKCYRRILAAGVWGLWVVMAVGETVSSTSDVTAGRLVTPGWMGLGSSSSPTATNCNNIKVGGKYSCVNATNAPVPDIGTLEVTVYSIDWVSQTYRAILPVTRVFERSWYGGNTWSPWVEVITSGNAALDPALNTGGINSRTVVSGVVVNKLLSGLMIINGNFGNTASAPANMTSTLSITIPASTGVDSTFTNVSLTLIPSQANDFALMLAYMSSQTLLTMVVKNGASAQTFGVKGIITSHWK